jgi:hypothetical protein
METLGCAGCVGLEQCAAANQDVAYVTSRQLVQIVVEDANLGAARGFSGGLGTSAQGLWRCRRDHTGLGGVAVVVDHVAGTGP